MRPYRVGILGAGVISRTYAADIQAFFHDLELTACADIDRGLAQKLASEFGIPKAYVTEELLSDEEIDIVVNLTPPQFHNELNRRILEAGKHLFSEKPFASSLEEARGLILLANSRGLKAAGAPDTFLASGLQSVRWYLDAGLIGKPFFATMNMTTFGYETWHPNVAAFYRKGSGPVFDMAPYYLSALVALLGPIERIAAFEEKPSETRHVYVGKNKGRDIPCEIPTHYTSILKMRCGAVVNFNVSFDIYKSNLPKFEIYGDGGTLVYPDPNFGGGTPEVYRKEQYTDPVYQDTEGIRERAGRFYELPELFQRVKDYSRGIGVLDLAWAIEEDRTPRAGGDMIVHVTEAMEGLVRAAEVGCFYEMETTCERPATIRPGVGVENLGLI